MSARVLLIPRLVLLLTVLMLCGCPEGEAISENHFVGKWKSSRLATPVYLYANGEWEIKTGDGGVLQYGIWQYGDRKLTWSFKIDSRIGHDVNPVLSATPREFRLLEGDRTTTVFTKLD